MSFGGSGTGKGSISTDSDVALSNVANGDTLQYDSSVAKWENAAGGSGGVSITSPNSTITIGGTASAPTLDVTGSVVNAKGATAGEVALPNGSGGYSWGQLPAADVSFDSTNTNNTSATDIQGALDDLDTAITTNATDITNIPPLPAGIHIDVFQNTDGTWPANPQDGLTRTWHGSGTWQGDWAASTAYNTGDGVYVSGSGVFTAKAAFTSGSTFNASNWNQVPMNTWDDIILA